jgi:teichuronic acid biosynthesis glycosyltransferase TuaH
VVPAGSLQLGDMVSTGEPCVVWMASQLWEGHGTDRRLAGALARYARILWVDAPISLAVAARARRGTARRVRPLLCALGDRGLRLTPMAPPGLSRLGVRATTGPIVRAQVRWAIRQTGIEPVAIVGTNFECALGQWGPGVVSALHGTDDYVAGAGLMGRSARRLRAEEKRAVAQANVVTAISPLLAQRWSALRGTPVPLIPNGCTPVRASPAGLPRAVRELPRPVAGLVGTLNARIDLELAEAITQAGFSLLVVGPHDPRWEPRRFAALTARPRVHYAGLVPESEVAAYIAAIDVGLTPYLDTAFNRASFPLKTLDYLSAGRPVVSTDLPAARWLLDDLQRSDQAACSGQILAVASHRGEFIAAARRLAGGPGLPLRTGAAAAGEAADAQRCRAFAARHAWSRRADALAALIGLPAPTH